MLALVALLASCVAPARDPLDGYRVATSRGGLFTVAWRVHAGGKVPVNEPFELDLLLFQGRETRDPISGATVVVSAWMPAHAHGMARRPEASEVAPGHYRVRGMLLHMAGRWELFVDAIVNGVSQRAQFELEL